MSQPPKFHPLSDSLALLAGAAGTASYVDQLEQGLRILATIVAIAAGTLAIYQRLRRRPDVNRDLFELQSRRKEDED